MSSFGLDFNYIIGFMVLVSLQEKYPPLNIPMPPEGCTNLCVQKLVAAVNEASASLPGWSDKAFKSFTDVKPVWGEAEEEK